MIPEYTHVVKNGPTLRAFGPKARKHTELMALLKERPGTYFRQEQSEEGFLFDNLG